MLGRSVAACDLMGQIGQLEHVPIVPARAARGRHRALEAKFFDLNPAFLERQILELADQAGDGLLTLPN